MCSWSFVDLQHSPDSPLVNVTDEAAAAQHGYSCGSLHPDGLILAGGTAGGVVKLWDIREKNNVANFSAAAEGGGSAGAAGAGVGCVTFSENGYYLSSGDLAGRVDLWDLRKLRSVKHVHQLTAGGAAVAVHSCAFDLSGSFLALGTLDGAVVVQAVKEWTELTRMGDAHTKSVTGVAWMDNTASSQIVSCSLDRSVKLFTCQ